MKAMHTNHAMETYHTYMVAWLPRDRFNSDAFRGQVTTIRGTVKMETPDGYITRVLLPMCPEGA